MNSAGRRFLFIQQFRQTEIQNLHLPVVGYHHVARLNVAMNDAARVRCGEGVIHRDVKSGNVMVSDNGQVKILDFGLAKLLDEDETQSGIDRTQLTEVGVPYGTATYAAPEQAMGAHVDARADIFSTGVLLYEML